MSWYVEVLLLNRYLIHETRDVESQELNDLLTVEKEIEIIKSNGMFSDDELATMEAVLNSSNFFSASDKLNLNRTTVSKTFKKACNKVSYKLGGYFTDDGYLSNLADNYNLSPNQIDKVKKYLDSQFRYRLARQIYEAQDNEDEFLG